MDTVETKPFSIEMAIDRKAVIGKLRQFFSDYGSEVYLTSSDFDRAMAGTGEMTVITDLVSLVYGCVEIAISSVSFEVVAQVGIHRSLPLKYTITNQE